jgi:ribosomal protein S18 acetylase RimI-like enzyme
MNDGTTIRTAHPDDWKTIAEFNTRLALETEEKKLVPDTIAKGVQNLLADPRHGQYFVAEIDRRIVGQMMHTYEWSDWRNGEIWWLQSVYVHPEFRRKGVFRKLYRHLEELAERMPNVVGIRLYVEKHNFKAFEAYRSLGMHDAGYAVMERMFEFGQSDK